MCVCVRVCVLTRSYFHPPSPRPYSQVTFFFTATKSAARPTGENIGKEACEIIEQTGAANVAAVANDNAQAETTSWEHIRE